MSAERTWTGNSEVDAAIVMLDRIDCSPEDDSRVDEVEATLRRQHARIQELEAMLEAVGAGGVSAQWITQAAQAPATAIQERDKFEQLMAASYPNLSFERHSYQYDRNRFEQYKVQWLWEGWQARAALDASDHIEQPLEMVAAPEPFGYFKAEPFGWRDCAETDEGAIALYEAPQPQAETQQPATGEPAMDVRCEGCGYMTHHREHMGCVRAAKQHTHPTPSAPAQPQADALGAERWRFIKRKLCLSGNGDGTCAMQALNLPARILGWPDVGELAIAQFLDAAIDAAIAAHKEKTE